MDHIEPFEISWINQACTPDLHCHFSFRSIVSFISIWKSYGILYSFAPFAFLKI